MWKMPHLFPSFEFAEAGQMNHEKRAPRSLNIVLEF
jgi:hypothetical protein